MSEVTRTTKWMQAARWAASGGNAQAWQVRASETNDEIRIELSVPEECQRHRSPMDLEGQATAMALGCLSKTLEIVALNDGWVLTDLKTSFRVESDIQDLYQGSIDLVFQLRSNVLPRYADEDVFKRRTDRTRFLRESIPENKMEALRGIARKNPSLKLTEFASEAKKNKSRLISIFSKVERVRWRSAKLLAALFEEISFSGVTNGTKIPASQLGVSIVDLYFLRFFSRFPRFRWLFRLGADWLPVRLAVHDFISYSDRVCFLEADASDRRHGQGEFQRAVDLGRTFQEVWIEANRQGIAFQPLGLPFIVLGSERKSRELGLSENQRQTLQSVADEMQREFAIDLRRVLICFRLGLPTTLPEKAPRRDVAVAKLT